MAYQAKCRAFWHGVLGGIGLLSYSAVLVFLMVRVLGNPFAPLTLTPDLHFGFFRVIALLSWICVGIGLSAAMWTEN